MPASPSSQSRCPSARSCVERRTGLRSCPFPTFKKESAMEIGARNRLEGKVTSIKRGTVMCQVKVELAGGAQMESVMTLDSLDEMKLKVGDKVRVAVKAVNVLLLKE